MTTQKPRGLTYRDAGVDIDAGNELVRRIRPATERTRRPESLSAVGGFAAMTRLPAGYREPVLVSGTDGVGTKLRLAMAAGDHSGVGQDLVAMCVNDILCTGAEPLLFLDYYATGALDVDVAESVIRGIAEGCELAGCELAGGETAEMPGFYGDGDYDLAGFCVGVVERAEIVDGRNIQAGHAVVGLASTGAHSNGYSLIRKVIETTGEVDTATMEALLAPTRIYARGVRRLLAQRPVHGMAHITGGGLVENLPRMLTKEAARHLGFAIDPDAWPRPEVFDWLQQAGNIAEKEMLRTFNCGVGFAVCVPARSADDVVEALAKAGERATVIGQVVDLRHDNSGAALLIDGKGQATLRGHHG